MNRFVLAAAACTLIVSGALAQSAPPSSGMDMKGMDMKMMTMMPSAGDSTSTAGYKAAMMKMMTSAPQYSGDADVDFMKGMRVHHQAAIDMAKVVVTNGKDAEAKMLAQNIVTAQEKEIATIDAWLKKKGV